MDYKIYKSSIYNRVMYCFMTIGVLALGLWITFYGIEKRSYNWIFIIIGCFICSYTIFVLQKYFTYEVVTCDEWIKIKSSDEIVHIKFSNIINVKLTKHACYIIEKIKVGNEYFIKGTQPPVKYSEYIHRIKVNPGKVPVIQKAFIGDYGELVEEIMSRLSNNMSIVSRESVKNEKSRPFLSTALLQEIKDDTIGVDKVVTVFYPYLLLFFVFLMTLSVYWTSSKGIISSLIIICTKFVFPIFIVVVIYILTVKYTPHIKKLIGRDSYITNISLKRIALLLVTNIFLSFVIIYSFFYIAQRVNL